MKKKELNESQRCFLKKETRLVQYKNKYCQSTIKGSFVVLA